MKTYYFSSAKSISIFSIMGLISVVMASCGSYKNSSYYDGDGIYGSSEVKNTNSRPQSDSKENNQYKDYFGSLQKDNEEVEIFTDVDSYNSDNYTNQDNRNEGYESGYSGWGSNPENVTVTIYDNNWAWNGWNNYFYGPSYGWGWNNWYGPSYGWGWNSWYGPGYGYYGWGWNNYYSGYYGYYNHHHVYNRGIRGSSFRSDGNRSTIGRRNTTGTRTNNYNGVRRNPSYNGTRNPNNNYQPRRNETTTPRNYTPRNYTPRNNNSAPRNYTPSRSENSAPRNNAPTRTETSSPRSYSPSSGSSQSSGGGRSNGGGRSGR
ncbi:hypothetical protein [Flavobacterium sp.]|uniref:hypothetical protein n=1 Tax=Flavobacterium sp. TaxID=239 RepID=UPI002B4B6CBF|nr:hypothetical protein [Flavobacterium sp.]HLF52011.1 hypothetical protein [Flavobacterium sp.]